MPTLQSPYHYLGLWRNPFGELTSEERVNLAVVDAVPWLDFLSAPSPKRVLQFVGGCGFGKTTHLMAIRAAWEQEKQHSLPYIYFPESKGSWGNAAEATRWPAIPHQRPVVLDEMQRCRWYQMRQALRGEGPLILGSHVDYATRFRKYGFDVQSVCVEGLASAELVQKALNRRIDASRIPKSSEHFHYRCPSLPYKAAKLLCQRYAHNLRAIEDHLYHELQTCIQEQELWQPAT